ncbi:HAD-IA family hydrolase [candidate division GN15 bacterium]|nr:HAD-IA family hydrolase [candidate division GN15 bacterium]
MKNQTIIFDLGKVICPFDVLIPCRKLTERCGIDPMEIKKLIFFGEPEALFETGKITADQFTAQVNQLLNLNLTTREFHDIWSPMFELDETMVALVDELRPSTQLILLSNTSPWHFEWVDSRYDIRSHFDELVLSYEVGWMKPAEPIYRAALALAEFPDTAIFIDDLEVNVTAAESFGIRAILFQGEHHLRERLNNLGYL